MPDALSKTIPIWCEVVNRATKYRHGDSVFGGKPHPSSVSLQEHHQIELRLDAWAELLATSSYDLPVLCAPLRPIWITPGASVLSVLPASNLFISVLCVCASRQIDLGVDKRSAGYTYIQGSADDHELWGKASAMISVQDSVSFTNRRRGLRRSFFGSIARSC
jgi:tRNA A64-2'-O-ribosylphosphate transferase